MAGFREKQVGRSFLKKNQKIFNHLKASGGGAPVQGQQIKVFLLLFLQKKKSFLSVVPPQGHNTL
jgi:hypothetical protein